MITLKQYKSIAKNTIKNRINTIKNIQDFIIFFVSEYNGQLTHNSTHFSTFMIDCQKYAKNDFEKIVKFLKKYTNIKSYNFLDNKLVTFANDKKTLCFNCKVEDLPSWYDSTKKESKKEYNNETFKQALKRLYKIYKDIDNLDESSKHILTIINI